MKENMLHQSMGLGKGHWIRCQNNGEEAKEHEGTWDMGVVCDRIIQYVVSAFISQNLIFFSLKGCALLYVNYIHFN